MEWDTRIDVRYWSENAWISAARKSRNVLPFAYNCTIVQNLLKIAEDFYKMIIQNFIKVTIKTLIVKTIIVNFYLF